MLHCHLFNIVNDEVMLTKNSLINMLMGIQRVFNNEKKKKLEIK